MASKPLEVLSYGEALVDFLPEQAGRRLRDVSTFRKVVGGAPANIAVGLARLGRKVGYFGRTGEDEFGYFLKAQLAHEGVDLRGLSQTGRAKTGITFVSIDAHGERSFMFWRQPSADLTLRTKDISADGIQSADIFTFGTNLLTQSGVREATLHAIKLAKESGSLTAMDPNIRLHLWDDSQLARDISMRVVSQSDFLKLNEEELSFLAPGHGAESAYHSLFRPCGVRGLAYTRGSRGVHFFFDDLSIEVDSPRVDVVDTTGAGDGFFSGFLAALCQALQDEKVRDSTSLLARMNEWDDRLWRLLLEVGCLSGALTCTVLGATPGLPKGDHPQLKSRFSAISSVTRHGNSEDNS